MSYAWSLARGSTGPSCWSNGDERPRPGIIGSGQGWHGCFKIDVFAVISGVVILVEDGFQVEFDRRVGRIKGNGKYRKRIAQSNWPEAHFGSILVAAHQSVVIASWQFRRRGTLT